MPMFAEVATPALLLDLEVLERNLEAMAARAERLGVALRPHFKTHKCVEIARRQVERSGAGGTVSTLEEAKAFAEAGIDDLLWAFPLIPGRLAEALEIASRVRLGLLLDSEVALEALLATGARAIVHVKIDCGYHRAGVEPEAQELLRLVRRIDDSARLEFGGLVTHSGHAYAASSPEVIARIADEEAAALRRAADRIEAAGIARPRLSLGSTPAMAAVRELPGIDEARPGNYALYDYTQVRLGSCRVRDCAASVLATVVSDARGGAVVDAGALALSKDRGLERGAGDTWGEIYSDYAGARLHRELRLTGLSQEHGKLSTALPVGTRVRILPNHSCLTVAQFDAFTVVRGDEVVGSWKIHRAR